MIQLIYIVFSCPNCGHAHQPIRTGKDSGHPTANVMLKIDCENCHEEYNLGLQAMIASFPKEKENIDFLHDINIIEDDEELEI